MDWSRKEFNWSRARAFLATAETGSLTAAAKALGAAQPTLGRQVAAFEKEIGVALFERVGRGLTLTPSGRELLEHVRAMAEAAERVSLAASSRSQSIEGPVRLSAGELYAAFVLPPLIEKLRRIAPGVTMELVASNAISDLRRREADLALRNLRPTDPTLIARRLRDDAGALYATPDYLARLGEPATPETLSGADFIGLDDNKPLMEGLNRLGFSLTERNFPIIVSSHMVHWELAKQGLGIGVAPLRIGDAEPAVRRALPEMAPIVFPVWLVAHRELATSRRVRLVFDLLAEALA